MCKRLINFGMETPEIAKRLRFTKTYVESLLKLAAAPREIRNMVATGVVAATPGHSGDEETRCRSYQCA